MSDLYKITQSRESGGLLRRVQINDGPWFVRISDIVEITKENEDLKTKLAGTLRGFLDIVELVMPDTYQQSDSRVIAARKLIAELEKA